MEQENRSCAGGLVMSMRESLLVLVLLALAACSGRDPVRIAFVADLTGPYSELGVSARRAVQLAVDQQNAEGGLLGRPIELTVRDDRGIPDSAIEIDRRLLAEGVHLVLGHMTSNMAPAIEKFSDRMLFISPTMSASRLGTRERLFVRAIPPVTDQAATLVDAMRRKGIQQVGVVIDYRNAAYTVDVLHEFERIARDSAGPSIAWVDSLRLDPGLALPALLPQLATAPPQGLLLVVGAPDFAHIAQLASQAGLSFPLYGSRWPSTPDVIALGGRAVEGACFTTTLTSDSSRSPREITFRQEYFQRYREQPTFAPILAYDATQILFAGVKGAGHDEPSAVRQAILRQGRFEGLQEQIEIDSMGNAHRGISLVTVRDGKFQRAEP